MLSSDSDYHSLVYAVAYLPNTNDDHDIPIADAARLSVTAVNEVHTRAYLSSWPIGLQTILIKGFNKIAYRYYLIDNSKSMSIKDGSYLNGHRFVKCTRWDELTDSMRFHIELSRVARIPTEFRLLNCLAPIVIGSGCDNSSIAEAQEREAIWYTCLLKALQNLPLGETPLCKHINEIIEKIKAMNPMLVHTGQRVSVVIFTDGESSDGDLNEALKPLKSLNVDILIRLCTDDAATLEYWNKIDADLELRIDILDDLKKECYEIMRSNPWLNYCQELQRFRESGVFLQEFDYLDEGKMSVEQMRKFISVIINNPDLNHPDIDWDKFMSDVKYGVRALPDMYNPKYSRMMKIVDTKGLKRMYKPGIRCKIM